MTRSVRSACAAALPLTMALACLIGCGGGDRAAETTPAATAPPAAAPAAPAAPPAGEAAAPGAGLREQLAQADKVWGDSCSTCHGDKGEGKGAKNPALIGGRALGKFKTGGELLAYVKEKMPKDDPGSLSEGDYLAVTAWLLGKNGKLGPSAGALTTDSAAALQLR
ncbi:MAG TPA: c-type cytochrome [Kofleriaceae bacterium]|nr:c-type cytochrome [Kofleriaceae bacterium]